MSFWKVFFGALLAFVVGTILVTVISLLLLFGIVATFTSEEAVTVKANSVLTLNLDYDIPEQTVYRPYFGFPFNEFRSEMNPGVYDIVKNIQKAKEDDNIKGIYLRFGFMGGNMATTEQIRTALADFKASGKFVIAYSELYSERAYYLCSVADEVFVNPKGGIEFNGLNARYTFFKRLLDKVGVEPQVFYDGKFKTATEPFRLDSMSAENEMMTRALLDDVYGHMIGNIAVSRKMTAPALDSINDRFLIHTAYDAVRYGIADSTFFVDQVYAHLRQRLGIGKDDKISFISLSHYLTVPGKKSEAADRIAILFAQGDIVDGNGDEDNIGSGKYVSELRKLREDDKVKAIVLRVNSPGGSALASDVIAREVQITAKEKPVVVSMGDYAASGGYYISAFASKIVAQPNTLTGSIGVFGILPNMQKLFEEKMGLRFDQVKTGDYSDFPTVTRALREDEKKLFQDGVDSIYAQFKATVAEGRKIDAAMVDSIAQGRVWTGSQALRFGLVDTLGGIDEAINMAARLANTDSYRIVQYPQQDQQWTQVMKLFSDDDNTEILKRNLGLLYPMYDELSELAKLQGVQARMPSVLVIE